jgi:hypothetical protein
VFALACETALHIDIDCELIEKAQIFPSAGKAPDITATDTPKRRKADESHDVTEWPHPAPKHMPFLLVIWNPSSSHYKLALEAFED